MHIVNITSVQDQRHLHLLFDSKPRRQTKFFPFRHNHQHIPVPAGSADEPAAGSVAAALGEDVARAGYYPELVAGCLEVALAGEEPVAHLVQAETSFADAVHRHLTVLALTPGRLIIVHVDDAALEDGVPGAVATSEAVPVRRISSLALSRGVARPAAGGGRLVEMTIAISWGAVRRLDLEPASCPDPQRDRKSVV